MTKTYVGSGEDFPPQPIVQPVQTKQPGTPQNSSNWPEEWTSEIDWYKQVSSDSPFASEFCD